ncbi:MAG: type II toxin-antitoxin system RelB/DinJ family antitoxin [Bifidobacteriaceae bacterium]|jgi:DNA-damage-inducible protein J|nr:type II toxin-antitoxin system RelB/DinJ family antitoxin [Bifidobacteriaceae bacterium]
MFIKELRRVSALATVTVRVDAETKAAATAIVEGLGLDLSTAVRAFMKQIVLRRAVPLVLEYPPDDPFDSPANRAALRESIAQADRGEFAMVTTLDELEAAAA